jgi:hypothetical protein
MKLLSAFLFSSLTLNVLLLGGLVMIWGAPRATTQVPPASKSTSVRMADATKMPAAASQPTLPAQFRWQQLDAHDFPTFVKNLRAIGCPEPTIRDIIEGELREIYAPKLQEVAAGSRGQQRELETLKISNERDRLLATLMAPAGAPAPAAALSSAAEIGSAAHTAAPDPNLPPSQPVARIPAAFAYAAKTGAVLTVGQGAPNVKAGSPKLGPAETTMLQQMQGDFAEALGDAAMSPESPVYRQRWNAERDRSNERFRAQFGVSAYLRDEMQAARAGSAAP